MNKLRVLLVDDHALVRRGLRKILESAAGIEVVGEASDGFDAIAAASLLRPDVLLMDVGLPGLSGIEATRRITAILPSVHVLMLSMHADPEYVRQSLDAGANGYVLKETDEADLVTAIRAVARGERVFKLEMDSSPDLLGAPHLHSAGRSAAHG